MKQRFFIILLLLIYIPLFAQEDNTNDEVKNTPKEEQTTESYKKDVQEEIDLIKERTGENKAGIYFKDLSEDDNAILFLDGFWEASFLGLASFEFFNDHSEVRSIQPILKQKANLSLWFLVNKQFYFEVLYKDEYQKSKVAFGYFGKDDSAVRHIRVGNSGIKFPLDYGYINTGGGNIIAPGITGTFAGEKWRVDSLLRYESAEYNSKTYYGKNEIQKQKISINSWVRGQFFFLPYDDLYGKTFRVFVKKYAGADWQEITADEFHIKTNEKMLILNKPYPNGVAINYPDNETYGNTYLNTVKSTVPASLPPTNDLISMPTSLGSYKTSILGADFLQLKESNTFSPFEIASFYETTKIEKTRPAGVTDSNTDIKNTDFISLAEENTFFSSAYAKTYTQVIYDDSSIDAQVRAFFPFITNTDAVNIYSSKENKTKDLPFYILSESYIATGEIKLPINTIAGSVRVFKNKVEIHNFRYDENTGTVFLEEQILDSDFIEVQWQEGKLYSDSGTVRLANGVHWKPIDSLDIFFASSSDWQTSKRSIELLDKYKFSSGIEFAKYNITTGTKLGFDLHGVRNTGAKKYIDNYIVKNHTYFDYTLDEAIYEVNQNPIFSKPHFYIDNEVIYNTKDKKTNLDSEMNASLDIWKITLSGSMSLQNKKNEVIRTYGHRVEAPIYFFGMNEDFFVNISEKILRRENKLSFEKYIDTRYLTSINYNKEFTEQKLQASISPIIPETSIGMIFTQLEFKLAQKHPTHKDITHYSYTDAWKESLIDSYSKGEADAFNRNGELRFIFNIFSNKEHEGGVSFVGFNTDATTKIIFTQDKKKQAKETTSFNLSIPFRVDNIFLTPLFSREISRSKPDSELSKQNNYAQDLNALFSGMGTQYWLFSKVLFYDLFDRKIKKQMQINDYNFYYFYNSYGFSLSRLLKNSMFDLFVPLEFTTKVSRKTQSEKTKLYASDVYGLEFLVKYLTSNISGKYGFLNWFSWYEQDELSRLYKYNFYFGDNFFKFDFKSEHSLSYFLNYTNKMEFKNEFECKTTKPQSTKIQLNSWDEKFSFSFIASAKKSLTSMIIKSFANPSIKDFREEKLSVRFFQNQKSNRLNYAFKFTHTQICRINEHGEINIFANIGGRSSNRNTFLLDISCGLSGKIEY